jgi:hypothetical protein
MIMTYYQNYPKQSASPVGPAYETLEAAINAAVLCSDPDHIEMYFDVDICEFDDDDDNVRNWCREDLTMDYQVPTGEQKSILAERADRTPFEEKIKALRLAGKVLTFGNIITNQHGTVDWDILLYTKAAADALRWKETPSETTNRTREEAIAASTIRVLNAEFLGWTTDELEAATSTTTEKDTEQ